MQEPNLWNFVDNLCKYMGTGMLGVFMIIGIIIIATGLINTVISSISKK